MRIRINEINIYCFFQINFRLVGEEFTENQKVESCPDLTEKIDCGLIFRSIGYFGVPVESGIPYDHKKGVVPNVDGFVEPGLQSFFIKWIRIGLENRLF